MVENARLAKAQKKASKFQQAILTTETSLKEYANDKCLYSDCLKSINDQPDRTWWENYPQWIKDIKGWYYDEHEKKIKECTMWEYTNELILDRSEWLIGRAGLGKSSLQRVWARFQGRSENKGHYVDGQIH